jgi:cold shock CspA family protein
MLGKLKFLDGKTQKWGFIVPEDGTRDVHFKASDFEGDKPEANDQGSDVEFDLEEDDTGRHARHVVILDPAGLRKRKPVIHPGEALKNWAFVPYVNFRARSGKEYGSALELLAEMAIEERWFFGVTPDPRNPFPILDNHLRYTFFKLKQEKRVLEFKDGNIGWATFNTGLVDRLYDPIYALFASNDRSSPSWKFYDFCVPGKGSSGKKLTEIFDPLPEPATYFSSNFDMLLDTAKDIHVDYEHVILDGVGRDRFPPEFLARHVPKGFQWRDYMKLAQADRMAYLATLSEAIEQDLQCTRAIKNRLEDAKALAEKRTRWNFKTAIPQYYPTHNIMSLLLPLALVSDEKVDIALVVTRNPSGSYQGRTVLPLEWAYKNARLVCRPDSDWLTPDRVESEPERLSEEDE